MKKALILILALLVTFGLFTGCSFRKESIESSKNSQNDEQEDELSSTEVTPTADTNDPAPEDDTAEPTPATDALKPAPEGDVVDGTLATQDNPVPLGTWASITVSDGGWPKPAQARIISVITDQTNDIISEYKEMNPLEEHEEFIEYVLVEYEVYFPNDFTDSDNISFFELIFSRANNQEDWIASDGSNYYWMGSVEEIDIPDEIRKNIKNGDTVKCQIVYPMIKGYTDYTLQYQERTEDLSAKIDTYFAIK